MIKSKYLRYLLSIFLCGQIIYQVAFPMEGQPEPLDVLEKSFFSNYSEESMEAVVKRVREDKKLFLEKIVELNVMVKKLKKQLRDHDVENEAKKLTKTIFEKTNYIKRLEDEVAILKYNRQLKVDFIMLFSDVGKVYLKLNSGHYYAGCDCVECRNAKSELDKLKNIKKSLSFFYKILKQKKSVKVNLEKSDT